VARRALKKNKQVLILSVGGLLARDGLSSIANQTKGRLWIPSGALAGVDALLAANQGKIKKVTLTTRKPVRGFEGVPFLQQKGIRLKEIRGERLIFEGSAAQAVRAFPKNINVAATLALAGVGAKRTRVRIFTSPDYRQNRHEVEIVGDFGRIRTEVENLPAPENPRTSALAVLSARATLKKILSRVYIGT
jgi:aspartate dehydrogenase